MENYSTGIVIEKRQPTTKNTYPIKLRVTIDRKTRYYGLGKYMTEKDFNKMMSRKPGELKVLRWELEAHEKRAKDILKALPNPTFDQFKRMFVEKKGGGNVEGYYQMFIDQLKKDDRHGTASSYECSLNSINKEMGLSNVSFSQITPEWLTEYTKKLEAKGKSISTVGIYLRPLRHMFNKAIGDGVVNRDKYPFGSTAHGKYSIPTSENSKRPLKRSELEALADYSGVYDKYRDFFWLSYSLMGLNFYDLLTLQWQQIEGKTITIIRTKTKYTSRKRQRAIRLYVTDEAQAIIDRYGNPKSKYVFDVITDDDTPGVIRRKVQNFTRNTNQVLKKIAEEKNKAAGKVVINPNISTVFARHSAASHALKNGASLAIISKTMGHTNVNTTSNYFDSMDDEEKHLAEILQLKNNTVPIMERGTNDPQTPDGKGIEGVPGGVPGGTATH